MIGSCLTALSTSGCARHSAPTLTPPALIPYSQPRAVDNPYDVQRPAAIPYDNDEEYYYGARGLPKTPPRRTTPAPDADNGYSPRYYDRLTRDALPSNSYPQDNDQEYVSPKGGYGKDPESEDDHNYVQPLFF